VSTPPLGTVGLPLDLAGDHSHAEHYPSCPLPWASTWALPPN